MTDLQSIARGCVAVEEDADGYTLLSRFSPRQRAAYSQTPAYAVISDHTAGIRLSFQTDGDQLRFTCRLPSRANVIKALVSITPDVLAQIVQGDYRQNRGIRRTWVSYSIRSAIRMNVFELIVDHQHEGLIKAVNGDIVIPFANPDHEPKSVDLYFPILEGAAIKDFQVNGQVLPQASPLRRLLCLGDSITQGCLAMYPSKTYVELLARAWGMEAINQGVANCTHTASHLEGVADNLRPDLVLIAYGTNDWYMTASPEELRQNIREYYAALQTTFPDCPIRIVSPIWRADMAQERPAGPFRSVHSVIVEEAAVFDDALVIDGMDISPHDKVYYSDEYLHPNDAGFAWIAARLQRFLA